MTKKKTQIKRKPSERTLLAIWSKEVRQRDDNRCFVCGSTQHIQAHHICQKRLWKDLKYDLNNGISLCPKHHAFGQFSVHRGADILLLHLLQQHRPDQYQYILDKVLNAYEKSL